MQCRGICLLIDNIFSKDNKDGISSQCFNFKVFETETKCIEYISSQMYFSCFIVSENTFMELTIPGPSTGFARAVQYFPELGSGRAHPKLERLVIEMGKCVAKLSIHRA